MQKYGIEVYVEYTTNGDYSAKFKDNRRLKEAVQCLQVLAVDLEHIIFLGYANGWEGDRHIYNCDEKELLSSKQHKYETNSVEFKQEYCFEKYGVHHRFTRKNLENDFKSIICDLRPDIIIAPEFDSHPDHRAASLLTDKCLGEILKSNDSYRPIVLKKYIHEGVWDGPKDYYDKFLRETLKKTDRTYCKGLHELDSPPYKWDDRIRLVDLSSAQHILLTQNIVYQAAKKHKSQTAWYQMQKVINSDIVYFWRRTDNLAFKASISVSSGDAAHISDFMYYDSNDICVLNNTFSYEKAWKPEENDLKPCMTIKFDVTTRVSQIVLCEDCVKENHVSKYGLEVNDTYMEYDNHDKTGLRFLINLPQNIYTKKLIIYLISYTGRPSIRQLEVYDEIRNFPYNNTYFIKYSEEEIIQKRRSQSVLASNLKALEKIYMNLKYFFSFKIGYELRKKLRIKNG